MDSFDSRADSRTRRRHDTRSTIPYVAGPPSIISSRMTDIASDDGNDRPVAVHSGGPVPDLVLRPRIAVAAGSSTYQGALGGPSSPSRPHTAQRQPPRNQFYPTTRTRPGESDAGSMSNSTRPAPSPSLPMPRSHVPSLSSHAFFHPLSPQKLQAQRGARSPGLQQPSASEAAGQSAQATVRRDGDEAGFSGGASRRRALSTSSLVARMSRTFHISNDGERAQSSTAEPIDGEVMFRFTTGQHHPTGSISEDGQKERARVPSLLRSKRSYRSSFLLPNKSDQPQMAANRSMHGGEKLPSVASSPRMAAAQLPASEPAKTAGSNKLSTSGSRVGRVFEYFEGNTKFFLGGRFQNSRQRPINLVTFLGIAIPSILFFIFPAPWLWHNVSPAIPLTLAYLDFICISSFIRASVTDPGILPRNLHRFPADDPDDALAVAPPSNDWVLVKSAQDSIAALEVPIKHCRTCNIWRPPRAHHCRLCDNCIETHDHHCVWINNCVGRRNYRYFFAFIFSATLLSVYIASASLAVVLFYSHSVHVSLGQAADQFPIAVSLVPLSLFLGMYPTALMGYHIFLMAHGETTREFLNSRRLPQSARFRVFNQNSWLKNWAAVLCRPRPPSYYRFKTDYQPGDQRLAAQRVCRGRPRREDGVELAPIEQAPVGVTQASLPPVL